MKVIPEGYYISIGKEAVSAMPAENYAGDIVVIDRAEAVADAIADLRRYDVLGFDTETRPAFKKGQVNTVSLIQLARPGRTYLFRINILGPYKRIFDLLEDAAIIKVGLSLKDDRMTLERSAKFMPQGWLDLQNYAGEFHIADMSLVKLFAILFGKRISKSQRLSNWDAPTLTSQQQKYAALDADACLRIYAYLKSGKFEPADSPYLTCPPAPETDNTTDE